MAKTKSHQKKFDTRIDFTPMVDMNMLLITFFMLCTTMIKSQTMAIALPSNDNDIKQEDMNKAKDSEAITIIIDSEGEGKDIQGKVYFFDGKAPKTAEDAQVQAKDPEFFGEMTLGSKPQDGSTLPCIREILRKRNEQVVKEIEKLKVDWRAKKFNDNEKLNDSIYQEKAKLVRNNDSYKRPVVIIKATDCALYEHVLNVLDEMQINNISRYQIDRLNAIDYEMLKAKTGNAQKYDVMKKLHEESSAPAPEAAPAN